MAFQGPLLRPGIEEESQLAAWSHQMKARNAAPGSAIIPGRVIGLLAASSQLRAINMNDVDGSSLVVNEQWGPQRPGTGRAGQGRVQGFPWPLALCTRADEVISIKSSQVGGGGGTEYRGWAGLGWRGWHPSSILIYPR